MLRSLALAGSLLVLTPFAGAVDRKVPDVYPTIQEAVDAAQAGDVILIEKGKYDSAILSGRSDLTLRRSGGGKVIIEIGDLDEAGIRILDSTGITIRDLELRGGLSEGIWATTSSDITIENCRFRETGDGIALIDSSDVTIRKCRIDAPQYQGIYSSGGSDLTIEGAVVTDAVHGAAVRTSGTTGVTVVGCRAKNVDEGIRMTNATASLVADCRIKKVLTEAGIDTSGDGVTLSDNVVKKVLDGRGLDVSGDDLTVEGNVIQKSTFGVTAGGDDSLIQGNRIKKSGDGMRVQGSGHTVSGNKVIASKGYGLLLQANGCTVDGNKLMKNGENGLVVETTGNTVTGNTGKKNQEFDLLDDNGEGANTYADNKFKKVSIGDGEIR